MLILFILSFIFFFFIIIALIIAFVFAFAIFFKSTHTIWFGNDFKKLNGDYDMT